MILPLKFGRALTGINVSFDEKSLCTKKLNERVELHLKNLHKIDDVNFLFDFNKVEYINDENILILKNSSSSWIMIIIVLVA